MEISNTLLQQITKVYETQGINYETFVQFADDYKKQLEEGRILTDRKVKFSPETVRQYKSAIEHFKSFQYVIDREFKINELNGAVLQVFERYLAEQGLTMNSVSLYISKIKAICNVLVEKGISYTPVRIKTPKEETTKIYLSLGEITQITNSETLTESERRIWDTFLIGSFTALRHATLVKFLKNPYIYIKNSNGHSYIDITAEKTNEQSIIPLSQVVSDILAKYNGKLVTTDIVYFNKMIKIIGEKTGIDNIIAERKTIGGEMKEVLVPKFSLLTSHSMRRTFISLAKQTTMTDREICTISGHSSVKAMQVYSRLNNIDKVKNIFGHEFFKIKV